MKVRGGVESKGERDTDKGKGGELRRWNIGKEG